MLSELFDWLALGDWGEESLMIDKDILRKLLEVEDLPTLPEVMTRIFETVENGNSSARDMARVLETDHAISTRILRMANSAFYALRTRVETIQAAIVVLGFDAIRQLALATTVFDALSRHRQFALEPDDFWMHSLGAAKAARSLGLKRKVDSPDSCFTAGLLHDIGKYTMALALKDEYCRIAEAARDNELPLKDVEREALRTTHAEVGAWLMERWRFPALFIDSVRCLYRASAYPGAFPAEVRIVALSSELSRAAGIGHAGDYNPASFDANLLLSLNLSEHEVQSILDELDQARDDMHQFLKLMKAA